MTLWQPGVLQGWSKKFVKVNFKNLKNKIGSVYKMNYGSTYSSGFNVHSVKKKISLQRTLVSGQKLSEPLVTKFLGGTGGRFSFVL